MSLPDSMRAAVYREKRRLEVEERPLPPLGPHDALLRVSHCGVCGKKVVTDRSTISMDGEVAPLEPLQQQLGHKFLWVLVGTVHVVGARDDGA